MYFLNLLFRKALNKEL